MQLGDAGAHLVEVRDLSVEFGESGGEQLLHVVAGSLAGVSELENLGDLGEREPGVATAPYEVDPVACFGRVVAIAARGPRGGGSKRRSS